jgi:hypothetical protein
MSMGLPFFTLCPHPVSIGSSEMSEALNLNQTAMSTDDIVLVDVTSAPAVDEDPWATIALPQAIGIEELEEGDSIDLLDSLTDQNHTLRSRVAFLESALEQSQLTMKQESERWESRVKASEDAWLREQEAVIARHLSDLTLSQQKVTELFQQLERSHQLTQRQQIVIDTMNTELRVSQEQVAQLERECAATQQNFTEQVQLVSQSEHSCRDLRSRLNRQQRYTLQFKAALEKSLEVPSLGLLEETIAVEPLAPKSATARVDIPKAPPVQPWSSQSGSSSESDWSSKAWVNAFLSDSPEAFPNDEAKTVYLTSEAVLESQEPVSYVIEDMPASENEMDIDLPSPRLDGWEEPNEIEEEPVPVVSPFITLKQEEGESESDRLKRESLLAIELPSFGN